MPASRSRPLASSLPAPLTPLLGRTAELEELQRLLGGTRLLTITGAGGSGKTRLALELAHRSAERFEDGAAWVDLGAVSGPELIAPQILDAIGVREVASADDVAVVVEALRDRTALLVLDNCEHLVDVSASIAETILRSCAGITVLTTTREALGITGEQTWLVPPLSESDALQLFADRARAVAPSFEVNDSTRPAIAHICARLDGVPLAIELAAARAKMLSLDQISARLDDAFRLLSAGSRTLPRHRTIRETIEWSFRLLSEDEQKLLQRLAVFAGTFSMTAAETICGDERIDAFDLLSALVDKSLVAVTGGRYRLLETVRQFAAEKLQQSGEREHLEEQHARFFFHMAERAERKIYAGATDLPTLAAIDEEIANIRAAFEWSEKSPSRAELELRLLWALHWYWFARGHFHEARRRISSGLARAPETVNALVRARAIVAAGNAAAWQADWKAIRPPIEVAVATLRGTNNLRALANALLLLGVAHAFADGDHKGAKREFDEALEVARRNGRTVALVLTLYWSGMAAQIRGDLEGARAQFEEGYDIGREIDNKPAIGHVSSVLGQLDLRQGRYDDALRHFRRGLDTHAEIDDRWGLVHVVEGVGLTLRRIGKSESGTRLLAAAAAAWLQLGARAARHASTDVDEEIRAALEDKRLRVVLASGAGMTFDETVALTRKELESLNDERGTMNDEQAVSVPRSSSSPTLRVRTLGQVEIWRDGERIDSGSQSARARELLVFLLCNPEGTTKERIGAALWPDADGVKLRNNFHVTVHRLRKTLGAADWVRAEGDTYAIDRRASTEFDVETFESEARAAIRANEPARLEYAISLYRGDFLGNASSGEWSLPVRDRLRDVYSESLRTLGRARMMERDFAAAADVYAKLLAFDDLDEQACRNLMTSLAHTGDAAGAALAYRRLVSALRRELDADPDPATTKLHARISEGTFAP